MRSILALAPLLVLTAPLASGQLSRPGTPKSSTAALGDQMPVVVLPAPDLSARQAAEDELANTLVNRYGDVLPVNVGVENGGNWEEVAGTGQLVWRTEIVSQGAFSLGVLFGEFDLPSGGEVYLYDPTKKQVIGAYTQANEQPNGMLTVQPILGDRLVVEYVHPLGEPAMPKLTIESVVHDYKDLFNELGAAQARGSVVCLIDVNCPVGDPYQVVKRSVLEVFAGGSQCSAGLLNNTAQDETPYFLTANHCGDMTNVLARFGFESTGCDESSVSAGFMSGATLRAASANQDSQLYELNNSIPDNFKPYYAGWGRGPNPLSGVAISHPNGQPKKISIDDDTLGVGTNFFNTDWDIGQIHGGSSGGPLFNQNNRVIGPACCVNSFECGQQVCSYGRFDVFWNTGNLAQWLDPTASGVTGLAGLEPNPASQFAWNGSGVNPDVYVSNAPILGENWVGTVDASGHPSAHTTVIVGRNNPTSGQFFNYGELLIDLSSPLLFQTVQPVVGGMSVHTAPIPVDFSLLGATAFTQALLFGGGVQATNRVKIVAGCDS
jgi:hypothetical protein